MSSLLNNGAPLAFERLPESKVEGQKMHLHGFWTKNDSNTARAGNPGLVKLSSNIVKVLIQWMRVAETTHCSRVPQVLLHVCGRIAIEVVVIPRESVMSIPPT